MSDDERALLLSVARWVAEQEDEKAKALGTTSNWADEMRKLIEAARPKG